jgi:hypothetical protein
MTITTPFMATIMPGMVRRLGTKTVHTRANKASNPANWLVGLHQPTDMRTTNLLLQQARYADKGVLDTTSTMTM